jgi:hypothetical protein
VQSAGVTVESGDGASVVTGVDGTFSLASLAVGRVTLTVRMPGYLEARADVDVVEGADTALPDLTLRGGDPNGDCEVNLSDLVIVTSNFRASPPRDSRSDINQDGAVDLQDLIMVSANLARRCPEAWGP